MEHQVIIFPRGQLSAKDKERLTKLGIVAVEADDPSKVVSVMPGAPLVSADDMLMAALAAIDEGYESTRAGFARHVFRVAREARSNRQQSHQQGDD